MKRMMQFLKEKGKYICLGCILFGLVLIGTGFAIADFDVYAMQTVKHEPFKTTSKTLEVASLNSITIDTYESIITIEPSNDQNLHITYQENKEYPVDYELNGTTLDVRRRTPGIFRNGFSMNWFDFTNDSRIRIRLQLPKEYLGKLAVKNTYSNISMYDIKGLQSLSIKNDMGDIAFENVSAKDIIVKGEYNEVSMQNIESMNDMDVKLDQGNIEMDTISAKTLKLNTSYGFIQINHAKLAELADIQGSQSDMDIDDISAKDLKLKASYGELELGVLNITKSAQFLLEQSELQVQKLQNESLMIESDYGDIHIGSLRARDIRMESEHGNIKAVIEDSSNSYAIKSYTEYGENRLPEKFNEHAKNKIDITSEYGDIDVSFQN